MHCPTVKIKADNDSGFIVINEEDFDKKNHELYVPPSAPKNNDAPPPPPPAPPLGLGKGKN